MFDVDEHARFADARDLAANGGVNVAVSNPCFELWLLLHFAQRTAHVTTAQVSKLLRGHLPGYQKHIRFDEVRHGYEDAVVRGKALDRRHADLGADGGNPSTGVYRLTERIRELGKDRRRR